MIQIGTIAVAGLIGTLVRQIQPIALHDPAAYASQMADMHQRYDPVTILGVNAGPSMVDLFERLGFFRIFSTWWFATLLTLLALSIVVCTIDRLPRLWRGVREIHPEQPPAFFDLRLPERAALVADVDGPLPDMEAVAAHLRRRHYAITRADGSVYADRNRYLKLATLITHLGLVLFLVGGAVTGAFGFETVLFLGDGQSAPVQAVGTPGNLLVKSLGFDAPRRADGTFADFRTNIAVYRDGRQIAAKTIRVNDPLSIEGFVFHQNTFGPAEDVEIRGEDGRLAWSGPILLDRQLAGLPEGVFSIPGSDIGLVLVLDQDASGADVLALQGVAPDSSGSGTVPVFLDRLAVGQASDPLTTAGYTIRWTGVSAFSGMVVKNDPGQGIIWLAFACLISGLLLTFYFPRRRVWARFPPGRVELAMLADRYVDADREFRTLVADLRKLAAPG